MGLYGVVLGSLAVWRVGHLLTREAGPWHVFERLRRRAGPGFWGELLDCIYCATLWISAPVAWWMGDGAFERLLLWPGLSAGALIVHAIANRPDEAAEYVED